MLAIARCTSATSAPSTTAMSIASTLPSAPKRSSAVSRSRAMSCAPPKLSALPSPNVPTIVPSNVPRSVRYDTVSPSSKFSLSAVPLSMASSSGPLGGRPDLTVTPWMPSSPCHDTPNVGPPAGVITSPSGPTSWANRVSVGSTMSTPSTSRSESAIVTSMGSRALSLSNACAARTSRSTSSPSSWKRLSNVARRLSARTNEPTTNETLAVIANKMASVRPQRARMLLRAMSVPALTLSPSA